jgi:16S rRNA (guanine527-N7)-methyltransferase
VQSGPSPGMSEESAAAGPDRPGTWAMCGQAYLELPPSVLRDLFEVLEQARSYGFLGPGPVEGHVARSLALGCCSPAPTAALDLGSGGGVPALPLALLWPASSWVLVDSNQRRSTWLAAVLDGLGLAGRARVLCERAEAVGRTGLRHTQDLVTARSFGAPAVTAECAAPLLALGGRLVVAEPPGTRAPTTRWAPGGLQALGLVLGGTEVVATSAGPTTVAYMDQVTLPSDRYPRRTGTPGKRPLF